MAELEMVNKVYYGLKTALIKNLSSLKEFDKPLMLS